MHGLLAQAKLVFPLIKTKARALRSRGVALRCTPHLWHAAAAYARSPEPSARSHAARLDACALHAGTA